MMYQHESSESCECGVCSVPDFERNNYFHGKMLSARDLRKEQEYFNEKRRLINRMILGWGIVCGLEVCLEDACLIVKPGLALDCCGRELLVCGREGLHANKIAEALGVEAGGHYEPIRWALCLEYHESKSEPVKVPSSCNQTEHGKEYNRIRDEYRLSIRRFEEACPVDHSEDCCPYDDLQHAPTIHKALVERSHRCPKCKECECVLLATGTLAIKPGQEFQIHLDDNYWNYRRIVYTNSELSALVRCFHPRLAHITGVNWNPGSHYTVAGFLDLLTREYLKVTFDQPLKEHTVTNVRSFRLSIFIATEGNCPVQLLIPVERIHYEGNTAVYYFDSNCIKHELQTSCGKLKKPAEVELVLHGSMVLNEQGRGLDAELIGDFPTGNGVEGGEFITYFTVGP
jgi:hypothetical protein